MQPSRSTSAAPAVSAAVVDASASATEITENKPNFCGRVVSSFCGTPTRGIVHSLAVAAVVVAALVFFGAINAGTFGVPLMIMGGVGALVLGRTVILSIVNCCESYRAQQEEKNIEMLGQAADDVDRLAKRFQSGNLPSQGVAGLPEQNPPELSLWMKKRKEVIEGCLQKINAVLNKHDEKEAAALQLIANAVPLPHDPDFDDVDSPAPTVVPVVSDDFMEYLFGNREELPVVVLAADQPEQSLASPVASAQASKAPGTPRQPAEDAIAEQVAYGPESNISEAPGTPKSTGTPKSAAGSPSAVYDKAMLTGLTTGLTKS